MYDIAFIDNSEINAEENFSKLRRIAPWARRVKGIPGILEAHKKAAKAFYTDFLFVVDGDSEVVASFDFSFHPNQSDWEVQPTYVWYSHNPVNGLEYGHGGLKLFHRKTLIGKKEMAMDMTTTVTSNLLVVDEVANVHRFNIGPFETWKTAFREVVKLSLKDDVESKDRVWHWTTKANESADFAKECLAGANAGKEFVEKNKYDEQELLKINNFRWLKNEFEQRRI